MNLRKPAKIERALSREWKAASRASDDDERERHVVRYMRLDRRYTNLAGRHFIPQALRVCYALAAATYFTGCASVWSEITREPTPEELKFIQQVGQDSRQRNYQWWDEQRRGR